VVFEKDHKPYAKLKEPVKKREIEVLCGAEDTFRGVNPGLQTGRHERGQQPWTSPTGKHNENPKNPQPHGKRGIKHSSEGKIWASLL